MKSKMAFYFAAALMFLLVLNPATLYAGATLEIVNGDPPNVGFNDPTPVAPVGGNTGTTLGEQRLIAFQAAAAKWGATLTSAVPIKILATWEALTCTSTSAVLGSAGAYVIFRDFGAGRPAHWYSGALANSLTGVDLDPADPDIRARFNINLGKPGCLDGTYFYLGLDNNHGTNIDLVTVLQHEFAHGLGFQTFTNGNTGALYQGYPTIYDDFLLDTTTNKTWTNMNDAERKASALNARKLAWNGDTVTAAVPTVLSLGTPFLTVSLPPKVGGLYMVGTASFGPPIGFPGIDGEVMNVVDQPNGTGLACTALSPLNAAAVKGNIALIDRGTCNFVVKTKNAQNAGAKAVIIVDNAPGTPPSGLGGTDPTITIPAVRVTQDDGNKLRAALANRSRLHSGMFANLGLNMSIRSGADINGHALMFSPNPYQSGSSISHWDTIAFPNQLMEPSINGDLTHEVTPPQDMTYPLLRDVGWF